LVLCDITKFHKIIKLSIVFCSCHVAIYRIDKVAVGFRCLLL